MCIKFHLQPSRFEKFSRGKSSNLCYSGGERNGREIKRKEKGGKENGRWRVSRKGYRRGEREGARGSCSTVLKAYHVEFQTHS